MQVNKRKALHVSSMGMLFICIACSTLLFAYGQGTDNMSAIFTMDEIRLIMMALNGMALMLIGLLTYFGKRFIQRADRLEEKLGDVSSRVFSLREQIKSLVQRMGRIEQKVDRS